MGCVPKPLRVSVSWFVDSTDRDAYPRVVLDRDMLCAVITPDSWIPDCKLTQKGKSDIFISQSNPHYGLIEKGVWTIEPLGTGFYNPSAINAQTGPLYPSIKENARLGLSIYPFMVPHAGKPSSPYKVEAVSQAALTTGRWLDVVLPFANRDIVTYHLACSASGTDGASIKIYAYWQGKQTGYDLTNELAGSISIGKGSSQIVSINKHDIATFALTCDFFAVKVTPTGTVTSTVVTIFGVSQ